MPLGHSAAFIAMTIVIWTFGEMLSMPLFNAAVASRAGRGNRGRYMGAYSLTFSIAFVISPAAGTWVYDTFGHETLWYGVGVVGVAMWLGAVLLAPAFRRAPDAAPSESV